LFARRGFPSCLQSTRFEWLRASVDGLSVEKNAAVQIKFGDSVHRKSSATHKVPDYYYGQLLHILAVTGFGSIDFWC
jgi:predicted phage-related endonuclease